MNKVKGLIKISNDLKGRLLYNLRFLFLSVNNMTRINRRYSVILFTLVVFFLIVCSILYFNFVIGSKVNITSVNGNANVNSLILSEKNLSSFGPGFKIPSIKSVTVIYDDSKSISYMNLSTSGSAIYDGIVNGSGKIIFDINVLIDGTLTTKLRPTNLTFSVSDSGPYDESNIGLGTLSSWLTGTGKKISESGTNLSVNYLKNSFYLQGYGSKSTSMNFLNESTQVERYNFSFIGEIQIEMIWYQGSTHNFQFQSLVSGLSSPVVSTNTISVQTGV